jgi:ZIP family zinc transporter
VAEAFLWGLIAASSLLIGAAIAIVRPPGPRTIGIVMAFGSGVLISALAYELVAKAVITEHGIVGVTIGLSVGCGVYALGDWLLARWAKAKEAGAGRVPTTNDDGGDGDAGGGLSIALGALLDGIPEQAALGLTILQGGVVSIPMLAAVFISNMPEAVASTSSLRGAGWPNRRSLVLWSVVVAVCAVSSAAGYVALDTAAPGTLSFVFAFAAGAILTMLATSMIPGAYRLAGREAGPVTVVGFAVAFALTWFGG